jgi:hypothetical protein
MALLSVATARAVALDASDVLILVNDDSPVSRSVANLYRSYHPGIQDHQVLYLEGLADCASETATPGSEILSRQEFEDKIAQPLRAYLIANDMVNSVYCIITTAGMPYRIECDDFPSVIYPNGSDANTAVGNRTKITSASVESELAVLWQIEDPAGGAPNWTPLPLKSRVVNPYQGYASGIKSWAGERDILARREQLRWTTIVRASKSPRIEGLPDSFPGGFSAKDRIMSPADIYLVARLDGPRGQGETPLFAIDKMLTRAAAVSDPAYPGFTGYSVWLSVRIVDGIDEAPGGLAFSSIYNLSPLHDFVTYEDYPVPPGAEEFVDRFAEADHFDRALTFYSGGDAPGATVYWWFCQQGLPGIMLWDGTNNVMSRSRMNPGTGVIALFTYGMNGETSRSPDYLLTGAAGQPLVDCVPGAIFASLESLNAVTMFTDVPTLPVAQAKIADFFTIGGSGAIGHAFEPTSDALVQVDFLLRNYLRDEDWDGVGDMTFVEAAFTSLPYLSWAEVVVGDPLMRVRMGPGGLADLEGCSGDATGDGAVTLADYGVFLSSYGSQIGDDHYVPDCDLDQDGDVDLVDYSIFVSLFGQQCYGD